MHKVLSKEYSSSSPNIYENFGGGELSPGKMEFGVVVARSFLSLGSPFRGLTVVWEKHQKAPPLKLLRSSISEASGASPT